MTSPQGQPGVDGDRGKHGATGLPVSAAFHSSFQALHLDQCEHGWRVWSLCSSLLSDLLLQGHAGLRGQQGPKGAKGDLVRLSKWHGSDECVRSVCVHVVNVYAHACVCVCVCISSNLLLAKCDSVDLSSSPFISLCFGSESVQTSSLSRCSACHHSAATPSPPREPKCNLIHSGWRPSLPTNTWVHLSRRVY